MTDQIISEVMEMSADISAWAPAFVEAQKAMGDVIKTKRNDHFKSKYAELADVIDAVQGALNANGFSIIQPVSTEAGGSVVRITTMLMHKSGQWVRSTLSLRPVKPDPQGVGSAITYGRRYGLMAMTGVAPEDDDGNAASGRDGRSQPMQTPPAPNAAATAAEIEREIDQAETEAALKEVLARNSQRLAALPDATKEHLRKVYALKQAAIREFSKAA
ncbi:ERF family protein [Camelimonas abortus]|uniref:ERF family protein n=1 Tax=Camelimonas abortus TaxID=1017184 RepID=A0ABV7LIG8_9HYPH